MDMGIQTDIIQIKLTNNWKKKIFTFFFFQIRIKNHTPYQSCHTHLHTDSHNINSIPQSHTAHLLILTATEIKQHRRRANATNTWGFTWVRLLQVHNHEQELQTPCNNIPPDHFISEVNTILCTWTPYICQDKLSIFLANRKHPGKTNTRQPADISFLSQ